MTDRSPQDPHADRDEALRAIACRHGYTTLETQNNGEDFREIAVWVVRQMLEEAWEAGRAAAEGR